MEDSAVTSGVKVDDIDDWELESANWTLATAGLGTLEAWQTAGLAFLAAGVSLVTICGNLIVLLSFMLERTIRQPSNYFIASLAVSDLLIGTFSMPLYTVYILSVKNWPLGEILCDLWLSLDYTACLCSIYTVFCITVDRFCSIRLPARYRIWRTERKVLVVVFLTWAIPISVFFTSIIGWQYFAGKRTVPAGKCYVQYMEDAVFNCILQVGYFWITLTAMIILYTGIYRVALDLHRRSEAKRRKKETSLAAMAQHTVSHLGTAIIGVTRTAKLDAQLIQQQQQQQQQLQVERQQRLQCLYGGESASRIQHQRSRSRSIVGTADIESTGSSASSASESDSTLHRADWLMPNAAARQRSDRSRKKHTSRTEKNMFRRVSRSTKPVAAAQKDNAELPQPSESPLIAGESQPDGKTNITWYVEDTDMSPQSKEVQVVIGHKHDVKDESERHSELPILAPLSARRRRHASWPPSAADARAARAKSRHCARRHSPSVAITDAPNEPATAVDGTKAQVQATTTDDCVLLDEQLLSVKTERLTVATAKESSVYRSIGNIAVVPDTCTAEQTSSTKETTADNGGSGPTASHLGIYKKVAVSDSRARQRHIGHTAAEKSAQTPAPVTSPGSAPSVSTGLPKITASAFWDMIMGRGSRSSALTESERRRRKLQKKNENRARKALRTITIILGAFVFCWTPWHILSLLIGFCGTGMEESESCVPTILYDISYWLCYLNSPINPFCYAFVNQQFKKTFIRILRLDWRRT